MDQQLVKALHQLPPEYQTVLILWAIDELSYKEIADAIGVPIGTVMSRLHRARQRLSDHYVDGAPQRSTAQHARCTSLFHLCPTMRRRAHGGASGCGAICDEAICDARPANNLLILC
jgi:predicted RNA polymerase sigma factor